jgi:hypothetical protein
LLWGKVTATGWLYALFIGAYIFFGIVAFFLKGSSYEYESESSNIPFLALVYFNAG